MAHLDLRRVREEVCLVVLHLDVFDAAVPTLASIQVEKRQCCLGKADVLACRRVVAMDLQRYVGAWLDVHHCEVAVHAVLRRPCRLVGGREFQAFLLAVGELAAADDVEVHLHVRDVAHSGIVGFGGVDQTFGFVLVRALGAQVAAHHMFYAQERQVVARCALLFNELCELFERWAATQGAVMSPGPGEQSEHNCSCQETGKERGTTGDSSCRLQRRHCFLVE
mmetsp:Transcript_45864/g.105913  ORF Transcript_45864/g.105913 Transcript_45864/m.105913 type:complete len:223 (-) Transcript_45864:101-769(-)